MIRSSSGSFETAALDLSYSSSFARSKSNDLLLPPNTSANSQSNHKRVTSNPFDILYAPASANVSGGELDSFKRPRDIKDPGSPKVFYNPHVYTPEHTLHQPSRVISDIPPVITMIDQSALQRSSSIVSREASIRRRHGITRRNRMIDRKSLDVHSPSDTATTDTAMSPRSPYTRHHSKKYYPRRSNTGKDTNSGSSSSIYGSPDHTRPRKLTDKLKFLFQVQRKTSLKRKSAYTLLRQLKQKQSKFQTKEELESFLLQCNANKIMRELLPRRMKLYKYGGILSTFSRKPLLANDVRFFNINYNNEFHVVSPQAQAISHPFGTRSSSRRQSKFSQGRNSGSQQRHQSTFSIVDSVYSRYRSKVLAGQHMIPPPFSEYFPEEAMAVTEGVEPLITPSEIDNMNKKLLFEVLLRRTLAAKIDYRLSQHRQQSKTKSSRTKFSQESDDSGSGSSDESDDDKGNVRHSHIPKLIHTDSEDSPDDESIDTDDLMQQNASLFSGLLPSPQISYKSDIFGSDFKLDAGNASDASSRMVKSRRTASTNDLLNLVRHVTPTALSPVENTFPNSPFNTNFKIMRRQPTESLSAKRDEELNVLERALGKPHFNYQLRPVARSIETFSSSEESGMLSRTPPVELSRNNSLKSFKSIRRAISLPPTTKDDNIASDKRDSTITDTSNSFQDKEHRRSQSTSNTSIFQDLDDLSSQLSSYLQDPYPKEQPRFVHKNIVQREEMLAPMASQAQPVDSQTVLSFEKETIHGSSSNINLGSLNFVDKSKSGNVSLAPSPGREAAVAAMKYGPDVKSMQGSFSVAGSEISGKTAFSDQYGSKGNVLRRDDSTSTRTTFKRDYRWK